MAATSSNGPVPSKHVFIHQLAKQECNTKVRFLGCAIDYDDSTGRLIVEHKYPRDTSSKLPMRAIVDINLLLDTIKTDALPTGSWINIIGYLQHTSLPKTRVSSSGRRRTVQDLPRVQAILMWNAGAVRVEEYEKTLEDHLSIKTTS